MPSAAIERALKIIRRRINDLESQCAALRERIASDREEEQLLARILAVRRGEPMQNKQTPPEAQLISRSSDSRSANNPVQAVIDELTSAGRPLHISDLMRLLALRRVAIPGAGTQANLITYLRRDRRFVRASRGIYALAEWGIDAMPPMRRRKRRRRSTKQAS